MMTHKERVLMAITGEMPDRIPIVPRLDLWYGANCGTEPRTIFPGPKAGPFIKSIPSTPM